MKFVANYFNKRFYRFVVAALAGTVKSEPAAA